MSTWKRLFSVVGIITGLLVLFGHHLQRDSYRCRVCSTSKYESQWRLGLWMTASIPLTPRWQRLHETRFFNEVLAADHRHDWMFAQGSPYYFFGIKWGGCAIGGGRHVNRFCELYESNSKFRNFIQAKLQNGSLDKSHPATLVTNPEQVDAFLQTYSER